MAITDGAISQKNLKFSTNTVVHLTREYIPRGFKVIVKSEVGGFTDKSADFLPAKWSLNSGTALRTLSGV
jgi:hypothetical protein